MSIENVVGILGFALSLIDFLLICWYRFVHLKFKVVCRYPYPFESWKIKSKRIDVYWHIINLSAFDIYIDSIGFHSRKYFFFKQYFHPINARFVINKDKNAVVFPLKLSSREAVFLSLNDENEFENPREYQYMYVATSCGHILIKRIPFSHPKR